MMTQAAIDRVRTIMATLLRDSVQFFDEANPTLVTYDGETFWKLEHEQEQVVRELQRRIRAIGAEIAGAARGQALITETDLLDVRRGIREMLASTRFSVYRQHGVYVHHDMDRVLGVDPPSQEEVLLDNDAEARWRFIKAADAVAEVIEQFAPSDEPAAQAGGQVAYRPNTAFIMMAIDKGDPSLVDAKAGMVDVFAEFGIKAITADDIEHEDVITDRILQELETSEFLLADVTGERPNVYYEIGHAHARGKRVTLYCRQGTKVHFDLAHRNCPSYVSVTDLKAQLRRRLEVLVNRPKQQ